MDTLFDTEEFEREQLSARLHDLAARGIFVGTSSWKYEGWLGGVYTRSRYLHRGRFSRKAFETHCLSEYAETFPTVCGDFAFYQFPEEGFWRNLFSQVPEGFKFVFKVPEQITRKTLPRIERYGPQAGRENEDFLNVDLLRHDFLNRLRPYRSKTALLIFEFGQFSKGNFEDVGQFLDRLDPFLADLPDDFRYALEVRNPEFLEGDYFERLRARGMSHVYTSWTKMPALGEQLGMPGSMTSDILVCRALLRPGRRYEDAVRLFSPYREIRDPYQEGREAMRDFLYIARKGKKIAFLFVNNRLEGNSPATIISFVLRDERNAPDPASH